MLTTHILLTALLTQNSPSKEPLKADLKQLAFMIGHWEGTRGTAWCEEIWTAPRDGIMQGSFRMHQDGKLVFSESERLVQEGEFIYLKIKHFRTDFTGIEEQTKTTDFVLTAVGKNTVTFYQKDDKGGFFLSYDCKGNTTEAWLHRDEKKPAENQIYKFTKK